MSLTISDAATLNSSTIADGDLIPLLDISAADSSKGSHIPYSELKTAIKNGVVTTSDTETVTNTMLAGGIANVKLANSAITVNGASISLGGSVTTAVLGTNTFTALQTITQASANAGIIASTGYSLTGSDATNMIDLAGTWNTTGTPTAIKLNITNTASNAASLLLDFQVDSTSVFKINKNGYLYLGSSSFGPYLVPSAGLITIFRKDTTASYVTLGNSARHGVGIRSDGGFYFSNSSDPDTALNSGLGGWGITTDGENIVSIKRDTYSQSFRVYNTYTSSTNNEYLEFNFASNVAQLLTVAGSGGGTTRALKVGAGTSVGTNIAGATTYIVGGGSTGNQSGGSIIFQVSGSGASGTSANALASKWVIESARLRPAVSYAVDIGSSSYLVNNIMASSLMANSLASLSTGIMSISIGQLIDFWGFTAPTGYILANGASVDSGTYSILATEMRIAQSGSSSGTTVTVSDTSVLQTGWTVTGTDIQTETTIVSIDDPTTITISATPASDGSKDFYFYPYGSSDNGATFIVPTAINSSVLGYKLIRYM